MEDRTRKYEASPVGMVPTCDVMSTAPRYFSCTKTTTTVLYKVCTTTQQNKILPFKLPGSSYPSKNHICTTQDTLPISYSCCNKCKISDIIVVVVVVVLTLKTVLTSIQYLLFLTLQGKETNFRGHKLTQNKENR